MKEENKTRFQLTTNHLVWSVYIALLIVLLPHTAWLFMQFEPVTGWLGKVSAYAGAFAFEAAIAVMTHKLARHIEDTPRRISGWAKFRFRYLNAFTFGLLASVAVSSLANLAHSVQFGQPLAIFAAWGIQPKVYQFSFGGVLPLVSLLFARVLSNVTESEDVPNPELDRANESIRLLRSQLRETEQKRIATEQQLAETEQRAKDAELRFAAAGDLFARLFSREKADRILAIRQTWPTIPAAWIAKMTESSPGYVHEVLQSLPADFIEAN